MEDRTGARCKDLRGVVMRGDRLIKQGDSWFSAKAVEAALEGERMR